MKITEKNLNNKCQKSEQSKKDWLLVSGFFLVKINGGIFWQSVEENLEVKIKPIEDIVVATILIKIC